MNYVQCNYIKWAGNLCTAKYMYDVYQFLMLLFLCILNFTLKLKSSFQLILHHNSYNLSKLAVKINKEKNKEKNRIFTFLKIKILKFLKFSRNKLLSYDTLNCCIANKNLEFEKKKEKSKLTMLHKCPCSHSVYQAVICQKTFSCGRNRRKMPSNYEFTLADTGKILMQLRFCQSFQV